MGLFSWLSSSSAPQAPDRSKRQICWDARDAYFACLDSKAVLQPGEEKSGACRSQRKTYEKNCAKSWVEYFNKRRVLQEEQKELLAATEAQAAAARNKR